MKRLTVGGFLVAVGVLLSLLLLPEPVVSASSWRIVDQPAVELTDVEIKAALPALERTDAEAAAAAVQGSACDNIDTQLWWTKAGASQPNHVHMGGCWPVFRQTSSSPIPFNVQFKLHLATGLIYQYRNPLGTVLTAGQVGPPSNGWPGYRGDGQHLLEGAPLYLQQDLPSAPGSMRQAETRFKDPDGTPMRLLRLRFSFDNSYGSIDALGWFQAKHYTNVKVKRAAYLAGRSGVSGMWSVPTQFNSSGGIGLDKTRDGFVTIDPDVHNGNFGTVIFNVKRLDPSTFYAIQVDTTTLPNGWHKLMLKASDEGRFAIGTLETVLVIPFLVNN